MKLTKPIADAILNDAPHWIIMDMMRDEGYDTSKYEENKLYPWHGIQALDFLFSDFRTSLLSMNYKNLYNSIKKITDGKVLFYILIEANPYQEKLIRYHMYETPIHKRGEQITRRDYQNLLEIAKIIKDKKSIKSLRSTYYYTKIRNTV